MEARRSDAKPHPSWSSGEAGAGQAHSLAKLSPPHRPWPPLQPVLCVGCEVLADTENAGSVEPPQARPNLSSAWREASTCKRDLLQAEETWFGLRILASRSQDEVASRAALVSQLIASERVRPAGRLASDASVALTERACMRMRVAQTRLTDALRKASGCEGEVAKAKCIWLEIQLLARSRAEARFAAASNT